MGRYKALAVTTKYWRPGEDFLSAIAEALKGKIADGDFVVVSEKAISTALGNFIDEDSVKPTLNAKFIATFWMRVIWGGILARVCRFQLAMVERLREYPAEAGSRHKQVALEHSGFWQALMFGSEGGIDGSNLPYSYASLPLKKAETLCQEIRERLLLCLWKDVCVIITDTDKTYSFRNFHFTPRPRPVKGIHSVGGFLAYVVGRALRLRRRATPLAVAGRRLSAERALEIAEVANRVRGFGSGRTVWDMADRFGVPLTSVTWEMLETVRHKPIVIVRSKR